MYQIVQRLLHIIVEMRVFAYAVQYTMYQLIGCGTRYFVPFNIDFLAL